MYNSTMAEIHARRRLRLRQLIDERFEGNQSAMARASGVPGSSLSNVFRGRENLSERNARLIEAGLGLRDGWMDREPPPGAVPNTPYKARIGRPPQKPYDTHAVEELLAAGYSQREIAQQLGVHESTVSRVVQRERAAKKEHKSKRPQHVAA